MKKKITALCLVIALAATAIVGGTLAYFTDTEEADNVFTIGNVDVQLYESYYHRAGAYMNNVPEDAQLDTNYVTDAQIIASADKYEAYLESQTLMPGLSINKMPYVKNTGNTNAYVRIRVMIPKELDKNYLPDSNLTTSAKEEFTGPIVTSKEHVYGTEKGEYAVYEFVRINPLTPGEMTKWNVWSTIKMSEKVTNQDLEAMIKDGVIENMSFGVKVEVDAIQADSFANATEAWAAFDAQTSNVVSTETYSANAADGFLTTEAGK